MYQHIEILKEIYQNNNIGYLWIAPFHGILKIYSLSLSVPSDIFTIDMYYLCKQKTNETNKIKRNTFSMYTCS